MKKYIKKLLDFLDNMDEGTKMLFMMFYITSVIFGVMIAFHSFMVIKTHFIICGIVGIIFGAGLYVSEALGVLFGWFLFKIYKKILELMAKYANKK